MSDQGQLEFWDQGQVIPTALHAEMQQSYLEYAMSVIVGRALPDVRDGLKPVHRRILFAMHELGLRPDRPFRKCARVVGDVLGKYHPHGDQSVYDALVRLVQDFSSRYPLLSGHGNFGSVDNDPPAAMRYTECRLSGIGNEALLTEIDANIVDFTDNFDGSQQEPTILPAQLPLLILNGATGIAVGMATNIPPHNLREVVEGLIALIDNPDLPDDKLFTLIPAPDFPTGGIIVDEGSVQETYRSGRGSITVRGVASLEEVIHAKNRKRTAIIVTELPFQVNKAAWIEKVAELVNQGRLEGIVDLRDESDRSGMRVVMELKKETVPEVLLEHLYRQTALQVNFGAIFLALVNRRPCQLSLRQLLHEFLQFRENTLLRRYTYERQQAQERLHILEGLVLALTNLDGVIEIIRHAADNATARRQLQARLTLTQSQADAILAMPLRRLTGIEQQGLHQEREALEQQISQLANLIDNRPDRLRVMKKELHSLKKQYGDDRRSRIMKRSELTALEDAPLPIAAPDQEIILQLSYRGYARRWEQNPRPISEDPPVNSFALRLDHHLLVFSEAGQAFSLPVRDIPGIPRHSRSRGTPLITLLPDKVERIVAALPQETSAAVGTHLVILTAQGRIKRTALTEFSEITARGLVAIKLKDQDTLLWVGMLNLGEELLLATPKGRLMRLTATEEAIPNQSRSSLGNQTLRLKPEEKLLGAVAILPKSSFLLITAQGFVKHLTTDQIRLAAKGSLGTQGIGFRSADDYLTIIYPVKPQDKEITLIIARSQDDLQSRTTTIAIPTISTQSYGEALIDVSAGERVVAVICRHSQLPVQP